MKEMRVEDFVRRLHRLLEREAMLAFFLGAGASVSSGICGAGALARIWVEELHATEASDDSTFEEWRLANCADFDPENPARPTHASSAGCSRPRRSASRRWNASSGGTTPGSPTPPWPSSWPTRSTYQALANFAAVGRSRPTVIKLHGDAMLQPRDTEDEIASLDQAFTAESVWVRHLDFDELMAVVKTEFDLPDPHKKRFDDLLVRYRETFSDLQGKVRKSGDDSSVVARSVEEVRKRFDNWFSVELEAQRRTRRFGSTSGSTSWPTVG